MGFESEWEHYTTKACKLHLGVKIYRIRRMIIGSDFKLDKQDRVINLKSKYEYSFTFTNGYPYDTIAQCIEAIDRIRERSESDPKEFAEIMNAEI